MRETIPQHHTRKPIRWWVAGLLGGALGILLPMAYFSLVEGGLLGLILAILPTILATVAYVKWGNEHNHFRNTIATALVSITFPTASAAYAMFYLFRLKGMGWDWDILPLIIEVLVIVYIPTFCVAILVWNLCGGRKKFQQHNITEEA